MAEISEYQVPTLAHDEKAEIPPSPTQSELKGKGDYVSEKRFKSEDASSNPDEDDDVIYVNGEPVITTGKDVSKFVVDIRDDGDPALTFRSFVLGTLCSGLGATLVQIYEFKPVQVSVSTVFLLLLNYSLGLAWAAFLPRRSWADKHNHPRLANFIEFINPGDFHIKEHVVSSLIASTASGQSTAVLNFAVQRLYYNTHVHVLTAVLATFSTAMFGYGLVGILRPLTVYPSEMVYWGILAYKSPKYLLRY